MTIFLVRHGETEWNRIGRYQGWSDSPLTAEGVAQARAIGARLRDTSGVADAAIVASPLGRAYRTASLIAEEMGRSAPVIADERLREISLGSWDGIDRRELRQRLGAEYRRFEWYFRSPDGESYEVFAGRISSWLAEIGERTVIAVAHGIVTRVLRGLYAGLPRAAALSLPVPQDRIFRLSNGAIEEIPASAP